MNIANITRTRAASLHLLISTGIAAAVTSLILFVWYPSPLFSAMGGQLLLPLVIGIDVCLGPLLTLIVFNPLKSPKMLALDLSFIALMQIIALVYGMYAAFEGRPVFVAYAQERFVVVPANALDAGMLQDAPNPRYRDAPLWGPVWVGAVFPTDPHELYSLNFNKAVTGMGIHFQPKYYVDLSLMQGELTRAAQLLDKLRSRHPEAVARIDHIADRARKKVADIGYIPLYTKQRVMTVLVNKKSGDVLDMLDVDPR